MQVRHGWLVAVIVLVLGLWPAVSPAGAPVVHAAATCADYPNQAAAQRAADTRDPDGDGIYCESLPCPCSSASGGGDPGGAQDEGSNPAGCTRPSAVQRLVFSASKYAHIRAHFRRPFARAGRGAWWSTARRRAPRPAACGLSYAARIRPRRVPAGGRAGERPRPGARQRPARLEGRRALRGQLREPLARRLARRQAAGLLQRHPFPLRVPVAACGDSSRRRSAYHTTGKLLPRGRSGCPTS